MAVSNTKTKLHVTNSINGTPNSIALRLSALKVGYSVSMSCSYSSMVCFLKT